MTHAGAEDSQEDVNSAKSLDSGRPSLALHNSSCPSTALEFDNGITSVDQQPERSCSECNKHPAVCSSSGTKSHGFESNTSGGTLDNQQSLDLTLARVFQERLNDRRISSMLKLKARQGDQELTSLLQDKGLDPNFVVMFKEKGLDPTILALLQRSSLDVDRDHRDNTEDAGIDPNTMENVVLNQLSWSEELRRQGFEKWIQTIRFVVRQLAGTPECAWVLFNFIFILETITVTIFPPKIVKIINATHE